MVAEREMPAWQWTRTRPQHSFTESAGQEGDVRLTPFERAQPLANMQVTADLPPTERLAWPLSQKLQVPEAGTPPWGGKPHRRSCSEQALTDVLDGLHEPRADVGFVVVLHGDALVLVMPLKVVGAVGGDVQQRRDAQRVEHVPPRSVVGAAKVEEGKDFYGATLLERKTTRERRTAVGRTQHQMAL